MAVPAYATDLNDIFLNGSAAWTLITGGKQTAVETDDFIMGTSCWSHDPFNTGIEGGMFNSSETIATDDAVYVWTKCDVVATLATKAAHGIQVCIGDTAPLPTPNYKAFSIRGKDDYVYGGWICVPVDPTLTASQTVGSPSSTTSWFGVRWNVPGSGAAKGYPMKVDAMRHGRQIEVTAGESANPASWDLTAAHDATTSRQWGICQPTNTGAALQGLIYWGTAAASVYSRDSNRTIEIIDTEFTIAAFTQILFAHASNDVVWDNVGLIALGTNNRGIIDVTANGTVTWTNSIFQGIDATTLLAASTFDGSRWIGTNEVDGGGGSLLGCKILAPTVAANSYGLLWNVATDPDGKLDGMEFSKGTAAHHAITFGTTSPLTMTLRDCDFGTGFSATAGGTTGDETFHVLRTGGTVTLNLINCTGNFGYRTAGATVNVVTGAVTVKVTTIDAAGDAVGSAAVHLRASDGTGPFPYQDSVTITRSGTTATVSHTAHGMATDDKIVLRGITDKVEDNAVQQITYINANSYSYTTTDSGSTSYTGTITSTFVALNGETHATLGTLSTSRVYPTDQPVEGWTRKSSGSPYYKQGPINTTIDDVNGRDFTAVMVSDE